jgi:hypothetical protein
MKRDARGRFVRKSDWTGWAVNVGLAVLGAWTTFTTLHFLMHILDRPSIFHVLVP